MNKSIEGIWVLAPEGVEANYSFPYNQVHKVSELPKFGCHLLILKFDITHNWLSDLTNLRHTTEYRLTPLFYDGIVNKPFIDLFDGPADEHMFARAALINERLTMVPEFNRMGGNEELALLSYVFARPGLDISGLLTYQAKYIFNYPLLNILITESTDFDGWAFLQGLVNRDVLAQKDLIDEIQICPNCDSGLLNFKNCCPNCHSVDIQAQKFIHCFSCGNIGSISNFLRNERMTCSKCHARLRQIGIDYDKPAEDKICNHCGFYFIDSIANIVCLVCQHTSLPNDLSTRKLYRYALTKRGEYFARGLEKILHQHAGNFFNYIDFTSFMAILSWQSKLSERADDYFFIMSLSVINEQDIATHKGLSATEKLLGEFFTKVRQLLRDTDLATRDQGLTLFFLPLTDEQGVKTLVKRVHAFLKNNQSTDIPLNVKVGYMSSKEIIINKLSGEHVVAELNNRMLK